MLYILFSPVDRQDDQSDPTINRFELCVDWISSSHKLCWICLSININLFRVRMDFSTGFRYFQWDIYASMARIIKACSVIDICSSYDFTWQKFYLLMRSMTDHSFIIQGLCDKLTKNKLMFVLIRLVLNSIFALFVRFFCSSMLLIVRIVAYKKGILNTLSDKTIQSTISLD